MGVGGARGAVRQWGGGAHHQPADGDPRRSRRRAHPRRAVGGGERLDLRRELLPRPLVGVVDRPGLADVGQEAGGQPRPVGTADPGGRAGPGPDRVPVGEGSQRRCRQRPRRPAGGGGGADAAGACRRGHPHRPGRPRRAEGRLRHRHHCRPTTAGRPPDRGHRPPSARARRLRPRQPRGQGGPRQAHRDPRRQARAPPRPGRPHRPRPGRRAVGGGGGHRGRRPLRGRPPLSRPRRGVAGRRSPPLPKAPRPGRVVRPPRSTSSPPPNNSPAPPFAAATPGSPATPTRPSWCGTATTPPSAAPSAPSRTPSAKTRCGSVTPQSADRQSVPHHPTGVSRTRRNHDRNSARGTATTPSEDRWSVGICTSTSEPPASPHRRTRSTNATLDASGSRWNIDSPVKQPPTRTPYNPPTSRPSPSHTSRLWTHPSRWRRA